MIGHRELIQDLRAHAHEAPSECAALMRRAATMLSSMSVPASLHNDPRHRRVKGAPCS